MALRLWLTFAVAVTASGASVGLNLYGGPATPYHDVRYYLKHTTERQQRIAWCQANPAAQRTDCGNALEAKVLKP
jgi:hypothetical protein